MKDSKNKIASLALSLHRKYKGKISIAPKIKIKDKKDLSLVYTPGVAAVSLYVSKNKNKTNIYTSRGNTVAVISDGSAVLGLGNIGPEGAIPVMEGKAMLFKHFANIDAVPLVLGTQDVDKIVETILSLEPSFGAINLEDIAAPNCFEIEKRLKQKMKIPVMHDDQHGTAMVVLAGLINALKVRKTENKKVKIIINGAGAAGLSIAKLLLLYGFENVILVDSKGVIYKGRTDLNQEKKLLSEKTNKDKTKGDLSDAISKADVFIGVSKGGALSKDMIVSMNKNPIIFALANPTPEISPDEARDAGAFIVATGRSDFPNQLNNALGFPGIFRGALDNNVKDINDAMLIRASLALAKIIKKPNRKQIIPSIFDKRVVKAVANAIR